MEWEVIMEREQKAHSGESDSERKQISNHGISDLSVVTAGSLGPSASQEVHDSISWRTSGRI